MMRSAAGPGRIAGINPHRIYRYLLVFSLCFASGVTNASKKEDMELYQDKLEKLQSNIARIQEHLKGTKKQRSDVVTELNALEAQISDTARKLKQLETAIANTRDKRKQLETELSQLNTRLKNQKIALSEQVRTAYSMGNQQNLKMLLNQQDPAAVGRTQQYFSYLSRAREAQIERFLETIEQRRETEAALSRTLQTQQALLDEQKISVRERHKQRMQRRNLLKELSEKIKNQESTLTNLESSRSRIENLLKSLGELLADIPSSPSEQLPFTQQKGKLPWPVAGRFLKNYGEPKNYGELKWNGVLIEADYGTPVRVISHGRVAFSDWLQGFGFITIVDHGDGYMSLYGHSESLFKETGDWVQAGEVIATAGDSGGQPQSGVYFELRARGKPINPTNWCSSKARHQIAGQPLI
jgi:septal ring factor EnvC (AmiA/AmiB activator)